MRTLSRSLLVAPLLAALACGGGSDGGGGLAQADLDQLTSTLSGALGSANGSAGVTAAAPAVSAALRSALSSSAAVNATTPCPVAGHVTALGNVYATCPTPPATGACTMAGALTFNFGDRTNNLQDCEYANGLIVDGTLNLTLSGTASGTAVTLEETVTGALSLDRKGPTGGLTPISINGLSSCFVFLTAKLPERTITGSICSQSVNVKF